LPTTSVGETKPATFCPFTRLAPRGLARIWLYPRAATVRVPLTHRPTVAPPDKYPPEVLRPLLCQARRDRGHALFSRVRGRGVVFLHPWAYAQRITKGLDREISSSLAGYGRGLRPTLLGIGREPQLQGAHHCLGAVGDPKLGEYVPHVYLGGVLADREAAGDLLVCLASDQEA
jgi:hypothetical protein